MCSAVQYATYDQGNIFNTRVDVSEALSAETCKCMHIWDLAVLGHGFNSRLHYGECAKLILRNVRWGASDMNPTQTGNNGVGAVILWIVAVCSIASKWRNYILNQRTLRFCQILLKHNWEIWFKIFLIKINFVRIGEFIPIIISNNLKTTWNLHNTPLAPKYGTIIEQIRVGPNLHVSEN